MYRYIGNIKYYIQYILIIYCIINIQLGDSMLTYIYLYSPPLPSLPSAKPKHHTLSTKVSAEILLLTSAIDTAKGVDCSAPLEAL